MDQQQKASESTSKPAEIEARLRALNWASKDALQYVFEAMAPGFLLPQAQLS